MSLCKCKRIEEYWNTIGGGSEGYNTRKKMFKLVMLVAIPIVGQIAAILLILLCPLAARNKKRRTIKEYRLSYIKSLIKKDQTRRNSCKKKC